MNLPIWYYLNYIGIICLIAAVVILIKTYIKTKKRPLLCLSIGLGIFAIESIITIVFLHIPFSQRDMIKATNILNTIKVIIRIFGSGMLLSAALRMKKLFSKAKVEKHVASHKKAISKKAKSKKK